MKIGLSFLGPSEYREATYYWGTEKQSTFEYQTSLFPEAVFRLFSLKKLIVFVTEEVKIHSNCQMLQKKLGSLLEISEIPVGKNEKELWDIFSIVAEHVPPHASIIIDVTHAFRSLPLIVYSVASYLRRIKNVKIERIIYGNWEARDISYNPPRAPIIDLTPIMDLQDWLFSIDAFQRRGDCDELADSLSRTQGRFYHTSAPTTKNSPLPRYMKKTATHLHKFSEAIRLLRPLEVFQASATVHSLLNAVQDEAALWAKPFAYVIQDFNKEFARFKFKNEDITNLSTENLHLQIQLIKYFLHKDLVVHAVLLAREWMVSLVMLRTNRQMNWRNRRARLEVEHELGQIIAQQRNKNNTGQLPSWYHEIPQSQKFIYIWDRLTFLRNDIAHCAMNTDAASPTAIRNNINELVSMLEALL